MEQHKVQLTTMIDELKQADAQWREQISAHESTLANLVAQTEAVEETLNMQSFGFYKPKYIIMDLMIPNAMHTRSPPCEVVKKEW